jgi:pimeloyl-[acyl-carrier protein] methyl ester esterase
VKLLFVHGWALDRTLWSGVLEALGPLAAGAVVLDAGYYGRPHRPTVLEPERRWLGIGQSLGSLELLADPPVPLAGVVAIDGFARYSQAPDFRQGVPARVLRRMAEWLEEDGALPVDFVTRAGGTAPPGERDIPRMVQGLRRLETLDGRGSSLPIWSLHADRDPIAPLAMAQASLQGMDLREGQLRQAADHLSPVHAPQACAALIRTAIAALA